MLNVLVCWGSDLLQKHWHWLSKSQPKAALCSTVCILTAATRALCCSRKIILFLLHHSSFQWLKFYLYSWMIYLFHHLNYVYCLWYKLVPVNVYRIAAVSSYFLTSLFFPLYIEQVCRISPLTNERNIRLMALGKIGLLLGFTELWTFWVKILFCFRRDRKCNALLFCQ